ncbi:MFS transporter [Streptomyces collinus]|uniref:Drug resistance transporter, EmrB/QacA subfamily protein n=1 Tax=Streptomyces collinus (strain DSM 40733 / Tue 365) TaxID=1214242 RepID=S5V2R2_STRC3|nr:MFS transporter [Streptomyces collinus]AGS69504.1 drug resistance transporter, EmrB/QacA subfamily protein [Streptomyces collinus Tu 365]UJA08145.1 MFS transporter [Streptomyces collinus]UJA16990.1 MFS transporter [Streptomyces collinus]
MTVEAPVARPDKPEKPAKEPNPHGMTDVQVLVFIVCAMATMTLALLDGSIVSSAVLPIVRDLDPAHGIDRFPWLITSYLLAATAAQPLYGRLSDSYGPRRIYLTALATFLAGSALCASAQSLTQLIFFRAVQGLGGGGLMSMTLIVIATLYPPKSRAGRSNTGGALIAAGIVAGPAIGGPLSQELSWRWIFLLNVPLAGLALAGITWALRLNVRGTRQPVDFFGSVLVASATCALLLGVKTYGEQHSFSGSVVPYFYGGLMMFVFFAVRQLKAADPLMPLTLFRDRVFRPAAILQFVGGFALLSLPVFLINYLNIVRGVDLDAVGLHLIPLAVGVVLVFVVWGRVIARTGRCRPVLIGTTATAVAATAGLALTVADAPLWQLDVLLVLLGAGLGGVTQIALFMTQSAADPEQLGVVTTTSRFATMLGTTIGGSVLGAVLSARFASSAKASGITDPDAAAARLAGLPPAVRHLVRGAFAHATGTVLLTAAGLLLLALITALLMGEVHVDELNEAAEEAREDARTDAEHPLSDPLHPAGPAGLGAEGGGPRGDGGRPA